MLIFGTRHPIPPIKHRAPRLGLSNGILVLQMNSKDDLPPLAERRPVPRRRVLLGGVATYEDGAYTLNCQIRDLNEKGARIVVSGSTSGR